LSAWGWNDNLFQGLGPLLYFATSGTQTIRVQLREDGLALDQIVLSPQNYLNNAPGPNKNDTTILPKTGGGSTITLVRQPYLQQVLGSTATVVWATRENGRGEVRYWANKDVPQVVVATTRVFKQSSTGMAFDYYQHEAQLGNLLPATPYNYDIFVDDIDATPGVVDGFKSAIPREPGTVTFIAFGDSGDGSTQQSQIASLIAKGSFDFALHAGDVAYENGTYQQFHDFFFAPYSSWLRSRPIYPSIGNHDDRTGNALPYRELFVLPQNGTSQLFPDHKERYYSFDYGPVHFVVLDSELAFLDSARRQEQINWLAADLAATTQAWRVALFHRPPYSSGFHGSDIALQQAFGPIFEQRRVQLVINGHEHNYERLVPWRESGPQAVTYVVTGGAGATLRPVGTGTQTMTIAVRALATRELTALNALKVVLRESGVGVFNGVVFAVIVGALSYWWFGSDQLGMVIGAAMIINLLAAALAGILIPLALDRLEIDPAIASAVFVTTVTDVVGFFAFLGLAAIWLL
jgi:hypothetical protein